MTDFPLSSGKRRLDVLGDVDGWLVLVTAALCLCGIVFIGSATRDDPVFHEQQARQALFVACGFGIGFFVLLPHYVHVLRGAWFCYGVVVLALLGLPYFAPEINGARRWYALPGFSVQPSEFAKLAVVLALAALLRFKARARTFDGLFVPMLVAGVPALLVLRQPDLGSSLVFGPVLLAMCYAAGASARSILLVVLFGLGVAAIAYVELLHQYQRDRVDVWLDHWGWDETNLRTFDVREKLRGDGFQPWQALIALGGGGLYGAGRCNRQRARARSPTSSATRPPSRSSRPWTACSAPASACSRASRRARRPNSRRPPRSCSRR